MARRKSDSFPPPDLSTLSGRIAWLLIHLFEGNMRRMAEAVGVTHSVLSKVVGGRQGPGVRLAEAIGSHPKVNPGWLRSGVGEPLLAVRHPGPGESWQAPIAHVLLPGPPAEHDGLFSGTTFPLASAFYRPDRYLYRVGPGDPIVRVAVEKIAPGDLLLLDADVGPWRAERRVLAGGLVAMRISGPAGLDYVLARVGDDEGPGARLVSLYGRDNSPTEGAPSESPNPLSGSFLGRSGRAIDLDDVPELSSSTSATEANPARLGQPRAVKRADRSVRTGAGQSASRSGEMNPPVRPQAQIAEAVIALFVMLIRR